MSNPSIDPATLAALDPAVLAAALAASEERAASDAAAALAGERVESAIAALLCQAGALATAATAAGLDAPDMTAVLAAAMERAAPVAPETLAAVIDPAPAVASTRRTRSRVERDWTNVPRGSVWTAALAGETGSVRVYVTGGRPMFTVTSGPNNGLTFSSPSRAVQSACGNPAGAGRRGEATVNGFLALTRNGETLDSVTSASASA
jgi:hypothetical protein